MELKPGAKLRSAVCTTEIIVVKAPGDDLDVTCGGAAMHTGDVGDPSGTPADGLADGTLMGKRYVNADETLEVLCTKPGDGTVGIGSEPLVLKENKPLPASD